MPKLGSAFRDTKGPLVRDKTSSKGRVSFFFGYILVLCGVVGLFLFCIWYPIEVVNTGYSIHRLSKLRDSLKKENTLLKLEYATLKSPGRIRYIASKKLKMLMPCEDCIVLK